MAVVITPDYSGQKPIEVAAPKKVEEAKKKPSKPTTKPKK